MQNDVYDYTQPAGTGAVQKNTVLRKTYGLLGLSFIPCAAGAFLSSQTGINLYTMFGNRWIAFGVTLAFFYGMIMLIEKNRHSNTGAALLMVFTFGMGVLGSAWLQSGQLHPSALLPATALGLWCSMVLNLNNMRDISSDLAAGKRTIAARLGLSAAKRYHAALLAVSVLLWWLWLPLAFDEAAQGRLKAILLLLAFIHLYFLKKAPSCSALDKLLPQWSLSILVWVLLLWFFI